MSTISDAWLNSAIFDLSRDLQDELSRHAIVVNSHDLASELATSERGQRIQTEILRLNAQGKKPLFTLTHDSTQPLSELLEGEFYSFRTSMLPLLEYKREMLMPAFLSEMEFRDWQPLSKLNRPSIGFVGHARAALQHKMITGNNDSVVVNYGFERIASAPSLRNPVNIGLILRQRIIGGLSRSKKVDSKFILRDVNNSLAKAGLANRRGEYLDNLNANLFALCVRGAGNYSIRLYEALALGRIPVILDTTMPLPMNEFVDWDAFSIRVSLDKIDFADQVVFEYFESKSKEDLLDIQHRARKTWETYLTRTNFFNLATPLLIGA